MPKLLARVDALSDEVKAWQTRPLDLLYPIVYLDVHPREGARGGGAGQLITMVG